MWIRHPIRSYFHNTLSVPKYENLESDGTLVLGFYILGHWSIFIFWDGESIRFNSV